MEQQLVEKYKDIPDDEFVPLIEHISDKLLGMYQINKLGEVRRISDNTIYHSVKESDGYAKVFLPTGEGTGIREAYLIHKLLAHTFLYNDDPLNKLYIDHSDRNPLNNNLDNLSWKTASQNMKNRKFNKKLNDKFIYNKIDPITNTIIESFSSDQLGDRRYSVYKSIRDNKLYLGYKWEVVDIILLDFYEKYGYPNEWRRITKFSDDSEIYCSDNGLIKYKNSGNNFEITPGHPNKAGYMIFNHNKKGYRVHRLVYEVFKNNGNELDSSIEIDHINCDSQCNIVTNLRTCRSHKENMRNPITRKNLGRPVKMFSPTGEFIREFSTISEAYEYFGDSLRSSKISVSCSGKRPDFPMYKGFLWCYPGEEYKIPEYSANIIYQYSSEGCLINCYNKHHAISEILKFDKDNRLYNTTYQIRNSIKTGKLAPDGHYYFRGPHNFEEDGST